MNNWDCDGLGLLLRRRRSTRTLSNMIPFEKDLIHAICWVLRSLENLANLEKSGNFLSRQGILLHPRYPHSFIVDTLANLFPWFVENYLGRCEKVREFKNALDNLEK